jgi:hypothetical protein
MYDGELRRRLLGANRWLLIVGIAVGVAGTGFAGDPPGEGSKEGAAGRREARRARPRHFPMPIECPDFPSALQAWNTFYKRTLVVTQKGIQETALGQMAKSREAWYQIVWRYYETPPEEYADDEHWHSDLAAITGRLHIAEWMATGGDLDGAHETLEPVRWVWLGVRERNGVHWFGDELTRYHDVMEPVVLWGTGQTHGGVTEDNVEEFEAEVAKLSAAWQRVLVSPYRAGRPRGRGGRQQFTIFLRRADAKMATFFSVVAERRLDEIPDAAREVKSAYLSLFMPFG